ncbi:MAG: MBL fold metallo-hydrolase, partial [Clostridia bacterium]|nr:MBL fold metallo-hydrolase [Clostridia bacterium]
MRTEIKSFRLGVTSCYLICGKDVVLVDSGMPNKLQLFQKELARLEVDPARIKLIV